MFRYLYRLSRCSYFLSCCSHVFAYILLPMPSLQRLPWPFDARWAAERDEKEKACNSLCAAVSSNLPLVHFSFYRPVLLVATDEIFPTQVATRDCELVDLRAEQFKSQNRYSPRNQSRALTIGFLFTRSAQNTARELKAFRVEWSRGESGYTLGYRFRWTFSIALGRSLIGAYPLFVSIRCACPRITMREYTQSNEANCASPI